MTAPTEPQQPTAKQPKPPRSSLVDFRRAVSEEIGSLDAWAITYKQDGREPHPDAVRKREIWEDLLALLDKMELCRAGITGVFRRRGLL